MSFVEADAWLRAVIDAVPQPLWVIDPDGKVAQTNETAARVLGYRDHRRLVGVPSHETLHRRREDGSHYPAVECPIVNAPLNSGK